MPRLPPQKEEKRKWREEWDRHDEVVCALIGAFHELEAQWVKVMEAAYDLARFNLFSAGEIAPKESASVREWAGNLWERIHQETGIAIEDMKCWNSETDRLWLG